MKRLFVIISLMIALGYSASTATAYEGQPEGREGVYEAQTLNLNVASDFTYQLQAPSMILALNVHAFEKPFTGDKIAEVSGEVEKPRVSDIVSNWPDGSGISDTYGGATVLAWKEYFSSACSKPDKGV